MRPDVGCHATRRDVLRVVSHRSPVADPGGGLLTKSVGAADGVLRRHRLRHHRGDPQPRAAARRVHVNDRIWAVCSGSRTPSWTIQPPIWVGGRVCWSASSDPHHAEPTGARGRPEWSQKGSSLRAAMGRTEPRIAEALRCRGTRDSSERPYSPGNFSRADRRSNRRRALPSHAGERPRTFGKRSAQWRRENR